MTVVALDAMGGDNGVKATVEGAAALSREDADISVLVVGDTDAVNAALRECRYDPQRLQIVASKGVIPMDANPGEALDKKPDCSVLTAARLVKSGEAHALVSAGHTGATILASARTFERMPGIRRAALASVYPTAQPHGPKGDPFALMLDVGATVGATAEELVGFALMGTAYSSIVSEIASPRVALLSNGTEPNKGTDAIVAAHQRLREGAGSGKAGRMQFVGNVEGLDIPRGTVDVVVCDGFLGNVVLKMLEGVSDVVRDVAKQASSKSLQWRLGLGILAGGLRELKTMTDWKAYGGAPLLGFDHVVIKAHGRSESRAIRNAIKVAAKVHKGDLVGRIKDGVKALHLEGT